MIDDEQWATARVATRSLDLALMSAFEAARDVGYAACSSQMRQLRELEQRRAAILQSLNCCRRDAQPTEPFALGGGVPDRAQVVVQDNDPPLARRA